MLGGPDNPAAAALQAALLPVSGTAASIQAALSQPDHSAGDGSGFDVSELLDQLVSAVGSASSSLADGVGAATAQVTEMKAAARTLVAAEAVCGALEEVMGSLKQQMAAASSSSAPEAAEESANLLRATADEVVAQLEQLRLTGLASMEEDDDGAAAAAALDGLLAAIQAKAEELAGQVQAGQMKGTAALEEVRLVGWPGSADTMCMLLVHSSALVKHRQSWALYLLLVCIYRENVVVMTRWTNVQPAQPTCHSMVTVMHRESK